MGDFHVIHASANDTKNGKDIYDFIDRNMQDDETIVTKLLKSWRFDVKMDVINKLADMTAGNFLYVHHALKFLKLNDILSMENVPTSLDKIYQLNFERVYGTRGEGFQFAEKILEVLSASKDPMKKDSIFKIINFEYKHLSRDVFDKEMHSLNHFVTTTADDCVFFTHISIYHWLIRVNRKGSLFYINKEKGHYFIAKYLFSIVKEKNNDIIKHIIDIVVHVSESKREDLVIHFKSLPPEIFNNKSISTSLLHTLAGQVNSYLATELCLHFVKPVDRRNEDDVTPAFIAAGKGNVDTLQALLDSGADISFRIQLPAIFGSLEDAVLITKTRTFWGYGLIDIAAQYGHVDIIHLLLTRNISLADAVNEMNVRPHHLACEFGHIKVLDAFLTFGPQFADQRCLYNAASHGHKQIVQNLLQLDVKDICLPCNGSIYWVRENENRLQAEYLTLGIPNNVSGIRKFEPKRKPFDDWWLISCETALHAASRIGFADIVQLLVSRSQNAMSCRDRAGGTPFLTAVINNRTETTSILYPIANLSDRCMERGLTDDELAQLSKLEIQKLSEGKCLIGLSVVHLLARYGLANLASSYLFRAFDWEGEDNEGNRPIHHAACHSDIDMINTLSKFLHVDLFSRTRNGSTAFHLAALCRPFNLIWLHDRSLGRLPQLYDVMNRSILQYMYISPLPNASVDGIQLDKDRRDMMEYHFTAEDITHFDSNGANILHSIIGNGYYLSMINMYLKYQDKFLHLIMRNNSFNRTPLDEAFYNVPNENFVVAKSPHSSIDQTLFEGVSNISAGKILNNISPVEQSIIYLVRIMSQHTEHNKYFGKYVHDAIRKSNVYLTRAFLLYMKAYDVLDYRGYSPLHTFMSIGNNPFMAEIFLANSSEFIMCGLPLEKSPLHQISLNINNSFWFVDSEKMHGLIKGITPTYLDQCFDAEGYNIFHRAVEGENYELVKYFIDRGLFVPQNEKLISIYLMHGAMSKFSFYKPSLQHYEVQMFNGSKLLHTLQQVVNNKTNYDLTLLLLLRKFSEGGYLKYSTICNASTATLSLVHLAAANGLKKSLEFINDNWGKRALLCTNVDLISPMYLSNVFNQYESVGYFETQNVSISFPKLQSEIVLALILGLDIGNLKQERLNCLQEILRCCRQINVSPHNIFVFFGAYRCLQRLNCSKLLPESIRILKSHKKLTSSSVVTSLKFLHAFGKSRNYDRNFQLKDNVHYRAIGTILAGQYKITFNKIFSHEMCHSGSKFMSEWLRNRTLHLPIVKSCSYRSSLYYNSLSLIIDPRSLTNVTYMRLLIQIGRYREMETGENLCLSDIHAATKINVQLPKFIAEAFPPLKDFSNSSAVP